MKYLLLIPVVLFSCTLGSYGQIKTLNDLPTVGYINVIDTVKCIMLVSDSSYSSNKVVWIKGHEIITESHTWVNADGELRLKQYEPKYLDVIKQPLAKSIIVWQSKEY